MTLIMTKGLPASGKSTWARTQHAKRVNRDDLRNMIDNGKWSKSNEKFIIAVEMSIAIRYLQAGSDVIVDDTNLAPKNEVMWKELADANEAVFGVKDFTDVSLEECIKRDQKRSNYVGEKIIRGMHNQFLKKPVPQVQLQYTEGLPETILCDLDGTLCLFGDKNPYDRDFENDELNKAVDSILKSFFNSNVVFVSGRTDKHRSVTQEWLNKHGYGGCQLFMRKDGDVRKDVVIKQEIFDAAIRGKFNVKFVLDDRDQIVNYWRSIGLTCLQVAPGDF